MISISVIRASLKNLERKKLSLVDKAGCSRPFFLDDLNVEETEVSVTVGVNWQTLIVSVRTGQGSDEHPAWCHNDGNTDLRMMVKLQKGKALSVLA